jgi:enoyl-[acyl-carrier-protein] reductase (NADH)
MVLNTALNELIGASCGALRIFNISSGTHQITQIREHFGDRIAEVMTVSPFQDVNFNSVNEVLATIKKHSNHFNLVVVSLQGLPDVQDNITLLAVNVCAPHGAVIIVGQRSGFSSAKLTRNFAKVIQSESYVIGMDKTPNHRALNGALNL